MQYDAPTHKLVTGGADRALRVWNLRTCECIGEVIDRSSSNDARATSHFKGRHTDSIYALRFSSNKIVSGSKDKTFKLWKFGWRQKRKCREKDAQKEDQSSV